jgi:hypothetical protein
VRRRQQSREQLLVEGNHHHSRFAVSSFANMLAGTLGPKLGDKPGCSREKLTGQFKRVKLHDAAKKRKSISRAKSPIGAR